MCLTTPLLLFTVFFFALSSSCTLSVHWKALHLDTSVPYNKRKCKHRRASLVALLRNFLIYLPPCTTHFHILLCMGNHFLLLSVWRAHYLVYSQSTLCDYKFISLQSLDEKNKSLNLTSLLLSHLHPLLCTLHPSCISAPPSFHLFPFPLSFVLLCDLLLIGVTFWGRLMVFKPDSGQWGLASSHIFSNFSLSFSLLTIIPTLNLFYQFSSTPFPSPQPCNPAACPTFSLLYVGTISFSFCPYILSAPSIFPGTPPHPSSALTD